MMSDIYVLIYALSVGWGHVVESEHLQWQDAEKNKVPEDEVLGCKVKYKLTHPDRILSMDEAGDKGDQSEDIPTRENKVMCESINWTIQGFTTLSGKAVLAVVIIKKGSLPNFKELYGYDFKADWVGEGEQPCLLGNKLRPDQDDDDDNNHDQLVLTDKLPSKQQMNANILHRHLYPGLVRCEFNEITVPGLVFISPGGGVTPEILLESLDHLDQLGVYPRGYVLPDPALVVDGPLYNMTTI